MSQTKDKNKPKAKAKDKAKATPEANPERSLITVEVEPEGANDLALTLTTNMAGLSPVNLVGWLKAAVPAYMRSRETLTKEAIAIGVALIAVRDFSPRGSLDAVKKSVAFGRSLRSLDRCIAVGQRFLKAQGFLRDDTRKLKEKAEVAEMFQGEFDFSAPKGGMLSLIADYVGGQAMSELMDEEEADALEEEDDAPMPLSSGGGRKKLTKAERQRADFSAAFTTFKKVWLGGREHLFTKDMTAMESWLGKALDELRAETRQRALAEKRGK
jgi:hypothetical protein